MGRLEERVKNVEKDQGIIEEKLDKVRMTQSGWGAVIVVIGIAVPLILKYLLPS